jgi:site-specific DNA recombinase
MNNKAVIYARVSSKEQETEGYSIPAQLKLLQEYAVKNDHSVTAEFTDVETAKKAGRTKFNNMLFFIKEHPEIKHILIEKTDRLLRNIADYALIDQIIESSDVKVHLVKENVILSRDSRSNEKFIFGIKALMAKNYVDNLSEETKKGMLEKAEQGIYPSFAPYGYLNLEENGRKTIKIDPATAPFVRKMFELYATGNYSLFTLRKKMLDDGMVYRGGRNFASSTVETMLKNEFYTGVFYWKDKKYENASHEPIISKELFQQVQDILVKPNKNKSHKGLFPYTNLITCGVCGGMFTAEIKKGKYIYYHCVGHKGKCGQPYLKQEVLEQEFMNLLDNINISDDVQARIMQGLKESFNDKIEYHNNCIAALESQVKTLQNRIDQAYLDKLDQKINEEFWRTNSTKWLTEKEALTLKILAHQKADSSYLENADLIIELAKRASILFKKQNAEEKRKLLNLVISNSVYKDGKLDVTLKKPFDVILKNAKSGNWPPKTSSHYATV